MSIKSENMIPRKNLMRLLDGLSNERIIYVCAPAGYGKTVSVRQWTQLNRRKSSAISLDEYDNEPMRFCERFCSALLGCQPDNAALRKIAGHPSFGSAPDEFAIRALDTLSADESPCLVLDGLHIIDDERVLRLLLILLRRLPENFQIVLISRNELPPGFLDLWLRDSLARVKAKDLCFSREEILLLYENRGVSITPGQADEIYRFTGGWAIGVGAVLLSGGDPEGESLEYLDEFIRANVWQRWDEETHEFMLKTAVVHKMTPALCAELTGIENSDKLLGRLINQNAFISRTEHGAFQYHRLFRDFLRHMLEERGGKEISRPLLEKAGEWYLAQGNFYSAVDCYMKCGDLDGTARCFMALALADREGFVIEKMLPILRAPMIDDVAQRCPYVYSLLQWAAFNEGRPRDMARYADLYYAGYHEIIKAEPRLTLNIMLVRMIDFRVAFRELMRYVTAAFSGSIKDIAGGKGALAGTVTQNMPLLHRATRDFSECASGDVETDIAELLSALGGLFGDEAGLLAESLTAGLLYEQGHLEKAYNHALAANAKIKEDIAPESKFFAMAMLIYVLDALEQQGQASRIEKQIAEMIEQESAYYLDYNFNALITRRKLADGDIQAARSWLTEHGAALRNGLDFYKLYGHLTTCRAYITCGDYAAAVILLTKILELAAAYDRPLDVIEAQILLSIAYWKKKRGFQGEAMLYLEQAVSGAHVYGYTQLFVNDGAELSGMLRRLQKRTEQQSGTETAPVSFVKMLYLRTLEHSDGGLTSGQPAKPERYTEKQRTVMKMLCEGKSYREIAEVMGVKLSTLRSHISLIYKKLDVTSETDAVLKIKASGLLSEDAGND